jgi:prolyl-tRNA synthetase
MPEDKSLMGLTVGKQENFSEWYNQVVLKAELADYAPIRGCMVIRPNAYMLWQGIQDYFNSVIKKKGVKNAYFPLLIPESFFRKEADHAEGFAPELAWVERTSEDSEERLAVRPTSETIMYDAYSKWVRSHRDLPLRINQWCNIMRWEVKQTKLFLRTREFLWQEGHCVYEDEDSCRKEAMMFLEEYIKLCREKLAIPVISGEKTARERFAGAKETFTIEALMPDGKALQMGTSHNLGQNFAKSFNVSFLDKNGKESYAWQNSWGFSTRLIGAVIMVHSDDRGFVMPPALAHTQIVIVPILFEKTKDKVLAEASKIAKQLEKAGFSVLLDDRDCYSAGWKFNEWELKGIPVRLEIGPKDIENKQVVAVRRDNSQKAKIKVSSLPKKLTSLLEEIQKGLLKKAEEFLSANTVEAESWATFKSAIADKKLVFSYFCENEGCEDEIKEETTATSRCIPFNKDFRPGKCVKCGKEAGRKVYFAKAY